MGNEKKKQCINTAVACCDWCITIDPLAIVLLV